MLKKKMPYLTRWLSGPIFPFFNFYCCRNLQLESRSPKPVLFLPYIDQGDYQDQAKSWFEHWGMHDGYGLLCCSLTGGRYLLFKK